MLDEYLKLYRLAHSNAAHFVEEAQILFERGKYARAFFLAFTALEEISKSQLAADVSTGFISEEEFLAHYLNHKKKLGRMAWATNEAQHYLDAWDDSYMELKLPTISARMNALYVSLKDKQVQSPEDIVTEDDARGIIRTVDAALSSITRNEVMGYSPSECWRSAFRCLLSVVHSTPAGAPCNTRRWFCLLPSSKHPRVSAFPPLG